MEASILFLPVLLGSVAYAAILLLARRLIRIRDAWLNGGLALCWLIGMSAAVWFWFLAADAEATANHTNNIGIGIIYGFAWITGVVPAPLAGTIIVRLGKDLLNSRGYRDME